MASLCQKRGKLRWRGRVMVHGQGKEKWFPDKTKASEREAVKWEMEAQKEMELETKTKARNQSMGYSIAEWSNEYLDEILSRHSTGTYKEKTAAFKRFVKFHELDADFPVSAISKDMCRLFLKEQNDTRSGYAANKDRKNLVSAWTWGKGNIESWEGEINPFQSVKKFKEIREPRYVPPEEDFWTVYDSLADQQDKAMLLTFLHLAARRREVFNLKRNDLDFQNNRARIWTKKRDGGMEYDWLPMTTELTECLSNWWKKRMEMGHIKSQNVFVCLDELPANVDYYGKPFWQRRHFMRRCCDRAGVAPSFTFHAIRHLTASILFSKGYSVGHIQLVLRHKSPTTTERYLKTLGLEMVRSALEEGLARKKKVISIEEKRKQTI